MGSNARRARSRARTRDDGDKSRGSAASRDNAAVDGSDGDDSECAGNHLSWRWHAVLGLFVALSAGLALRDLGERRSGALRDATTDLEAKIPPAALDALRARLGPSQPLDGFLADVVRGNDSAKGLLEEVLSAGPSGAARSRSRWGANREDGSAASAAAAGALETLLRKLPGAAVQEFRDSLERARGLDAGELDSAPTDALIGHLRALTQSERSAVEAILRRPGRVGGVETTSSEKDTEAATAAADAASRGWARENPEEARERVREWEASVRAWSDRIDTAKRTLGSAAVDVVRAFLVSAHVDAHAAERTHRQLAERCALLRDEKLAVLSALVDRMVAAEAAPPAERIALATQLLVESRREGGSLAFEVPMDWKGVDPASAGWQPVSPWTRYELMHGEEPPPEWAPPQVELDEWEEQKARKALETLAATGVDARASDPDVGAAGQSNEV